MLEMGRVPTGLGRRPGLEGMLPVAFQVHEQLYFVACSWCDGATILRSFMSDDSSPERRPSAAEERWREETLRPALAKSPERPIGKASGVNLDDEVRARFTTVSGKPVERLYTPADLADWDAERELGGP